MSNAERIELQYLYLHFGSIFDFYINDNIIFKDITYIHNESNYQVFIAHWGIGSNTLIKHYIFPNCHMYTLCAMYTDHLFINVISEIDAALNICCRSFAFNIKQPLREKK